MDAQTKRVFTTVAQVNWELKTNGLPSNYVVTVEELHLKVRPTKGAFLAALNAEVEKGAQVPGPGGEDWKATPLSVYGDMIWKQISGPVLAEDGETQKPVGNETE